MSHPLYIHLQEARDHLKRLEVDRAERQTSPDPGRAFADALATRGELRKARARVGQLETQIWDEGL